MMNVIHITEWMLWIFMAPSVLYVAFYALVSLLPSRTAKHQPSATSPQPSSSFLILFPAYKEDSVIVHSVRQFLEQTYPKDFYHIGVISDHMQDDTNELLRQLPITLFTPQFEKSSKAKAMQYAIKEINGQWSTVNGKFDYVIILDADNVVLPEFLEQVNVSCQQGYRAIQCHRCAKNCDNDVAVLDGVSEEINNTIFRKAHNTIGLSSALIGSGMCFSFEWFKQHVDLLNSAVEDRELESLLLQEKIFIKFEENIHVFDEKVSNHENFERQRLRWLNGQLQSLLIMLPNIPHAIATININYIDKAIQQALIPRSILLVLIPVFSLIMLCIAPVWSLKWWILFLILCLSLYIAIPSQMRNSAVFGKLSSFPALALKMLKNLLHLNKNNKDFLHTTHGK
jgi:cellulose synthase/poly-beta-1,6-N-acetylglucosamine synthase-like glycosyltransferase